MASSQSLSSLSLTHTRTRTRTRTYTYTYTHSTHSTHTLALLTRTHSHTQLSLLSLLSLSLYYDGPTEPMAHIRQGIWQPFPIINLSSLPLTSLWLNSPFSFLISALSHLAHVLSSLALARDRNDIYLYITFKTSRVTSMKLRSA